MLKEINDKSNRNAHARNFTSFCGINSIKIPGAIDVEIYIHLFPSFGPLIMAFYRIQNIGWLKKTESWVLRKLLLCYHYQDHEDVTKMNCTYYPWSLWCSLNSCNRHKLTLLEYTCTAL